MGLIRFNGRDSTDFGLVVEQYPNPNRPARRGTPYTTAGRSGSQVSEENAWDNYIQPYLVHQRAQERGIYIDSRALAAWLLGSKGYCRLEDSYEPDIYRLARFAGPMDIQSIAGKWGKTTLEFDCQPQRYLKSGERVINLLTEVRAVYNPTQFDARPLLHVHGVGKVPIWVQPSAGAATTITIDFGTGAELLLDCEAYDATYMDGANANSLVSFSGLQYATFPALPPRGTRIQRLGANSGTSYLLRMEITPRWWTL